MRIETQLSPSLSSGNGRLVMTLVLNRWITMHGCTGDPGDRAAFHEMCKALHRAERMAG